MSYEFQSTLHRTAAEMCAAIAREWLSAGGNNDNETMREFLAVMTDEQLTAECVEGWGLDQPEGDETSWFENRGIDASDLELAFADLRRELTK